jgi:hypothetical protein
MKCAYFLGFLIFLTSLNPLSSSHALDVAWDGYFRARGNGFYNLDMDRSQGPNARAYTDFRFRLNPSFLISDKIRVRSSLNFVDGVLGDSPFRRMPYNNPALTNNRLIDPNETGAEGTAGTTVTSTGSYAGQLSPDGWVTTTDLQPLYLRRLWAEFDFDYGTLMVGRMPNHFGMGITSNAGDDPNQEVGSTRDRIVFDTSFGPYYVRPGIGWLMEGALDRGRDDFMEYFFIFGRKTQVQEIAMSLAHNSQNRSNASVPGFDQLKTSYWAFDFYLQNQFEAVNLMAETSLFSGKVAGKDLIAVNAAGRAEFNLGSPRWRLLTEAGYASGTSESDLARNDIKSVPFSRDYDISLILFEEALPGGIRTTDSSGTKTNVATAPHTGAISNAIYGRFRLDYDATPYFKPALNVLVPYAASKTNEMAGRFYGVEYNILTHWPISPHWATQVSFGHFIPGPVFNELSKEHSVLLLRAGVVATF